MADKVPGKAWVVVFCGTAINLCLRLSVSGAPVVRGDRLYAGAVASEGTFHNHVIAIDRYTGDLVYATRVSNGQQELNLFGRQLQECTPMPLTEVDGVLYLGTNLGVLAAVDALLGTPIWAHGYETERIPSTWYWFEAPRRWPCFANGPPLVSGDVIVAAPADSTALLGLGRRTADRLFAVPPQLFDGQKPLEIETLHAVDAERAYVGGPRGVVAIWLVRDPARGAQPGEIAWVSWFGEQDAGAGHGFLAEDALWVPTYEAVYRIDPVTGKVLSASAREGRDAKLHVHLVWGDGVLLTASRLLIGARFDEEVVLHQARERARLRPDEPGPLLDAADIHLAAGQVSPAVDPAKVLITSVVVFIVIPLAAGWLTRTTLLKSHGKDWFEQRFLPKFHPVMIGALLLTLVLIFAFQAQNLTQRWLAVLLIAVPIIIQVYFNSSLTYLLMRWLKLPHNVASPGALIGASNFFELAVAVAITLFGPGSGATLAAVVGVLVEVPVMLSVCNICNGSRGWYQQVVGAEP